MIASSFVRVKWNQMLQTMCVKDCGLLIQKYQYNNFLACFIGKLHSSHMEIQKKIKSRMLKNSLGQGLCLGWHDYRHAHVRALAHESALACAIENAIACPLTRAIILGSLAHCVETKQNVCTKALCSGVIILL